MDGDRIRTILLIVSIITSVVIVISCWILYNNPIFVLFCCAVLLFGCYCGDEIGSIILTGIYAVISLVLCIHFGIPAASKAYDSDRFAINEALKSDNIISYKKYVNSFPEGRYVEDALDSIAAKVLINVGHSNELYTFLDTCSRSEIVERALLLLDDNYDNCVKYGHQMPKELIVAYVRHYQTGLHYEELKQSLMNLEDDEAYEFAVKVGTLGSYTNYLEEHPTGIHRKDILNLITQYKIQHKYDGNYLSSGSQPYAKVYGNNGHYDQCAITVGAYGNSDVVVVVKHNNKYGKVAGHAYIHQGGSYSISLTPGTYQTFFYYGSSWNPHKKLDNGLVGGFMYDEEYGKDNPVYLGVKDFGYYVSYDELSYSLREVVGGNFSMQKASRTDVF